MPSTNQQNILIVMADQLSALALGCYGNTDVLSPHIDQLAAHGVVFDAAYTSSPLCTPARYAFMTGQNISRCGGYDNAAYMPSTKPTLAHYLRLMGYRTCLAGKMHFVGADQLHGFEDRVTTDIYPADFGWIPNWHKPDERIDRWYHNMSSVKQAGVAAITNQLAYDDEVGHQAKRVLYEHARSDDKRPLCLVASFIHPHDPYATRQKYWDLYQHRRIALPSVARPPAAQQDAHSQRLAQAIGLDAVELTEAEIINARRAYYGNVTYVDEWLGELRAVLQDCGLADNTTIIVTADHGDMLGELGLWYKMSMREWSCRIPLLIHQPKRYPAGRIKHAVALVDLLPTLLDIAAESGDRAVALPELIEPLCGHSLQPIIDARHEEQAAARPAAISEYCAEATAAPLLMIRSGRYKFITCPTDAEQLFDLHTDPNELVNLATRPEHASRCAALRQQAARHWDVDALKQRVIADQDRRRAIHAALRIGRYHSWDFTPPRDAANEYTRSHRDLTEHDVASRFPRPQPFGIE